MNSISLMSSESKSRGACSAKWSGGSFRNDWKKLGSNSNFYSNGFGAKRLNCCKMLVWRWNELGILGEAGWSGVDSCRRLAWREGEASLNYLFIIIKSGITCGYNERLTLQI